MVLYGVVKMPSQFNQGGFGNPMQVQGSMGGLGGGLGNINPTLGQQKQEISKLGVQGKSPMPGVNSAFMKQAPNPQKGTPSGARSFMNSGAGANGMLNTMKSRLGQNKLGGFGR